MNDNILKTDDISSDEDLDDEFGDDLEDGEELNADDHGEENLDDEFGDDLEDGEENLDDELEDDHDDEDEDDVEAGLDDLDDDDDVEADLDAILKERIAAGDDQATDDEEEAGTIRSAPAASGEAEQVVARGHNEFSCPHCFLLVNSAAVVDDECPHCGGPVGAA